MKIDHKNLIKIAVHKKFLTYWINLAAILHDYLSQMGYVPLYQSTAVETIWMDYVCISVLFKCFIQK